jgi:uncharacterized protein (DUF924 family)
MTHPTDVLAWWFGDWDDQQPLASHDAQTHRWWSGSPEADQQVRDAWTGLHAAAVAGSLERWRETTTGRLALLLLLDQGSRVIGRGSAEAFAHDPAARAVCDQAIAAGDETLLRPIELAFLYLPLMHSESLADHERATLGYERLAAATADTARSGYYSMVLNFQHRHRAIIERFGRYPHRNQLLGRASTPEELEFLSQPGSSF